MRKKRKNCQYNLYKNNRKTEKIVNNRTRIFILGKNYQYSLERYNGIKQKNKDLFLWNIGIIGFTLMFTEYKKIIETIAFSNNNNQNSFVIVFVVILITAFVICCISLMIFWNNMLFTKKICMFDTSKKVEKKYKYEELERDFDEIIRDVEGQIDDENKSVNTGSILLMIGVVILILVEICLHIAVCI